MYIYANRTHVYFFSSVFLSISGSKATVIVKLYTDFPCEFDKDDEFRITWDTPGLLFNCFVNEAMVVKSGARPLIKMVPPAAEVICENCTPGTTAELIRSKTLVQ